MTRMALPFTFKTLGAAALFAVMLSPMGTMPAFAQSSSADVRSLAEQVERLQRELTVLQRNVYQGQAARPSGNAGAGAGAAPNAAGGVADLQVRLDDLDSRISQLVGQIEETNHRITAMEQKFERFSSDLDVRLSGAGGGAAGTASAQGGAPTASAARPQPTPPAGAGDPSQNATTSGNLGSLSARDPLARGTDQQAASAAAAARNAGPSPALQGAALPDGTPDDQYKYAFGLLGTNDFAGAERALSAFVEQHPTHSLAGNAQYWLGETYYVRNDFNAAARAFAVGYQKYPKSAKAPDNLLKLGLSLGNLNKPKEACQSYGLLKKDFPKAIEQVRRADGEIKRLRCS